MQAPVEATIGSPLLWTLFIAFVLAMLALDLGVFHRKAHSVRTREAAIWCGVWVSLALLFGLWIWNKQGADLALKFYAGYLVEYALSMDNVFVFLVVFSYFSVPSAYQHRVLFWGILGALVMRLIFILAGAALINTFHWILYVFGAFLLYTGVKLMFQKHESVEPGKNPVFRLFRRFVPMTADYEGQKFVVVRDGRRFATPLLLVLVVVEATDVVFAVDSIPAIFGITRDQFIVFTSNIFAIMGLRSLYFLLSGVMDRFHYLKIGLGLVLAFIGVKMLTEWLWKLPIWLSLTIIALILGGSVVASLLRPRDPKPPQPPPSGHFPDAERSLSTEAR
jgi:tellurite resistance protein TerC